MTKLKATERIDYFVSDLWDNWNNSVNIINKILFVTVLIPIAIYTAVIIVAGSFFDSTYLPLAYLFVNMSTLWTLISLVTLPLLTPLVTLFIIWGVIWFFIFGTINFFKSAILGIRKD
jgi:hypothetical protein